MGFFPSFLSRVESPFLHGWLCALHHLIRSLAFLLLASSCPPFASPRCSLALVPEVLRELGSPGGSWDSFRTQLLLGPRGSLKSATSHPLGKFLVSEVGRVKNRRGGSGTCSQYRGLKSLVPSSQVGLGKGCSGYPPPPNPKQDPSPTVLPRFCNLAQGVEVRLGGPS